MVKKVIKVSSPGKIILSGEHSVVYGQPAILTAVNLRLYLEIKKGAGRTKIITDQNPELAHHALFNVIPSYLNVIPALPAGRQAKAGIYTNKKMFNNLTITIRSEIPVRRGFGSSAALATSLAAGILRWLGKKWDKNLISQIAFSIEKKQHRNPSGADNSIATFGGTIIFQKGNITSFSDLPDSPDLPDFIFLDSGQAAESTGEMVSHVSCHLSRVTYQTIIKAIGQTTRQFIKALNLNRLDHLNHLIKKNQRLLENLGVVSQKAKKIIRQIESLGGAAKICGAGGIKKGSGILLCYHQNPQALLNFARENGLKNYQLKLGAEGLRDEKS